MYLLQNYFFDQVYDVTKFLEDHPGGDDVLLSATGMKLTEISLRMKSWLLSQISKQVNNFIEHLSILLNYV